MSVDLTTTYLGLRLKNPLVPSASPFSRALDSMKRLEDNGASAVVMYSLFEEQVEHEEAELHHYTTYGSESHAEALSYFPEAREYNLAPDQYVELIRKAVEHLEIPVIGSLNGISTGGWIDYAKMIEEAGADALELNAYHIPTDVALVAEDVEIRYLNVLRSVKESVKIPVAVKLSPYFSSMANMAQRLVNAGADGLVLFNRFYQPDIDLENLDVKPAVVLSDSNANRLPMRWIAVLHGKVKASLAATSGIHTAEDAIKLVMAGADVTMMCSALLKHGPEHLKKVAEDMERWMTEREYSSVSQMKGSMSYKSVSNPSAFERANYMKALNNYRLLA